MAIIGGGATLNAAENGKLVAAQQGVADAQKDLQEAREKLKELEEAYRSAPDSKKAELKKEIQTQRLAVKQAQRDNKVAIQTFKKASNKNNQSGAFVGGEATLGFARTTPIATGSFITVKEGLALTADFDIKGGYKFYFTEMLGVRAHAGLGYGSRFAAMTVSGLSYDAITYTTTGLKVSLGADLLFSPSGKFGIFAGGGFDIHNWTHDVSMNGVGSDAVSDKQSGTTTIPKIQVGMRFGGFEIAGVYNLSAIQPANSLKVPNLTYGNTMGVKLGYYYSF